MEKLVSKLLKNLICKLREQQTSNGSWVYPFETGIATDCYMIILLRTLEINDEQLIQQLVKRIIDKQKKTGAWKLFYDEKDGNLSATIEAYYALLYSGFFSKEHKRLKAAEAFILSKGGLHKAHTFTKIMLAITGQLHWPLSFPLPVEFILLPHTSPVHFYSLSVYGRANLAPIMILWDTKYTLRAKNSPDLSNLASTKEIYRFESWSISQQSRSVPLELKQWLNKLKSLPKNMNQLALSKAKKYMLDHIEPDGTLFNYFSSTFLMIFALLALNHSKQEPIIQKAIQGLKAMQTRIDSYIHMQYTTAEIWNTSLISYALQEASVLPTDSTIIKANRYLLSRQQEKLGDWVIDNPNSLAGGWGFSEKNTIHPDVDDTTAALRAIARSVKNDTQIGLAWEKGIRWLISMQNDDGGWAAFERNKNNIWLNLFPLEKGEYILRDPSSADLTGRTLEFIGGFTELSKQSQIIQRAVQWLIHNQEKDGSWYGRWGICYLYGTWSAVTGLKAVGISSDHHTVRKAVNWLKKTQNSDGGWGESCQSDLQKTFIPLEVSTVTHTSWALDALIAASDENTAAIQAGVDYLLHALEKDDWTTKYPKGQGMAGDFYIHYHSYRYIFPLLALSHYRKKFLSF